MFNNKAMSTKYLNAMFCSSLPDSVKKALAIGVKNASNSSEFSAVQDHLNFQQYRHAEQKICQCTSTFRKGFLRH
jgi:hypothetical protein